MQINVEEMSACRKKLHIEVPADQVTDTFNEVVSEYCKSVRVDGFRKGRAPDKIIRLRFGKQIRKDVQERLLPKGYQVALEQEKISPVAVLDVDHIECKSGQPFTFRITCDVSPDFELPVYRNIGVTSEARDVAEEDIDGEIVKLMDRFAAFEDVEREVGSGDLVQVDFDATIDGEPLSLVTTGVEELGSSRDFWMQTGEEGFLPELGKGVIGSSIGDCVTIPVLFPDDFSEAALQGRTAEYVVTVKAVREKTVPPLDEERIRTLGAESEDDLRSKIRDAMEGIRTQMNRQGMRNQVLSHLLQATQLDLPESVVQDETRQTIYEMVSDISKRGASEKVIEDQKSELFDAASRSAEDKVKVRYILTKIAQEESIDVAPQEFDERVHQMAQQQNISAEDFRSKLQDSNQLDNLESDIRLQKTLDFLVDEANVMSSPA